MTSKNKKIKKTGTPASNAPHRRRHRQNSGFLLLLHALIYDFTTTLLLQPASTTPHRRRHHPNSGFV